jgi:hypothetical protein
MQLLVDFDVAITSEKQPAINQNSLCHVQFKN